MKSKKFYVIYILTLLGLVFYNNIFPTGTINLIIVLISYLIANLCDGGNKNEK